MTQSDSWPSISIDLVEEELRAIEKNSKDTTQYSKAEADAFNSVMGVDDMIDSTMQSKIESIAAKTLSMQQEIAFQKKRVDSLLDLTLISSASVKKHLNIPCSDSVAVVPPDWTLGSDNDVADIEQIESRMNLLHDSKSFEEYQSILESEFKAKSPLKIPLTWLNLKRNKQVGESTCIGSLLGSLGEVSAEEEYQDGKDLQRDQILLNGVLHQGGNDAGNGYSVIVQAVVSELKAVAAAVSQKLEVHQEEEYIALAKRILNAANRTESGGSSYEAISYILLNKEEQQHVILRPNSMDAKPLNIAALSVKKLTGHITNRTACDIGNFRKRQNKLGSLAFIGYLEVG